MTDRTQATHSRRRRAGERGTAGPVVIAALATLPLIGLLLVPQAPEARQIARARGQALFEEKRYADAEASFQRVVESDRATAADWYNLALARYERGDDAGVLAALESAAALDPGLIGVHYLRGLVAKRGDRAPDALAAFRRAAELDPADAAVLYNLAWAHEATGAPEQALPIYDRIIGMGFDVALQHYASSLYRRGFLDMRSGDREAGQAALLRSREAQQRLSQAQRAPAALEAGLHKRILVPPATPLAPADAAPDAVEFTTDRLTIRGPAVADVLDGSAAVIELAADGGIVGPGGERTPSALPSGLAALGDADRDGRDDLAVVDGDRIRLFRRAAEGAGFEPWTVEGLPPVAGATSISWVDVDHDGDLDLAVTRSATPGLRIFDNLGGGAFADTTGAAGVESTAAADGLTWADFDGDNDTDLYLYRSGGDGSLLTNLRGGRFDDIAAAVGAAGGPARAVVAEDLDGDGDFDLALAAPEGIRVLTNDGDGTFRDAGVRANVGATDLLAGDLDNDGWIDLVAGHASGTSWLPNGGALELGSPRAVGDGRPAAVLDWNGDGALDVLVDAPGGWSWRRQSRAANGWLAVSLAGIKNNLRGRGAKIEVKAEGLYQIRTLRDGRAHFGLGGRTSAEVVRITWPNGIVQNELDVTAGAVLGPVSEVERLEGSCPLLYTWDGERWRFINEVLGVAPLGMPLGVGAIHPADWDEYVPVPGEALRPRNGGWELRFTEELREAGYLDAMRLIAVDRPAHMQLLPDERFVAPPHPSFRLFAVTEPRPVRATDQDGTDWTAALARVDGEWTRPFDRDRYEGLATPHWLQLDLDEVAAGDRVRLFLTGWVYWATGSINLVVDEDPRTSFEPVALQVRDGARWRTVVADVGLPNAKNSTLAIDLSEWVAAGHRSFRLGTTLRLYWDAAYYTVDDVHPDGLEPAGDWASDWNVPRAGALDLRGDDGAPLPRLTVLAPESASIDYRGFSRLHRGRDGFETFEYGTRVATAPWDQHRGHYTRYGDVTELLQEADDRFVIVGTGDEVAVRFAGDLPPLRAGWTRDWLVYLNGWVKDGDPNTVAGDRVEPLPFHAMTRYPYGPDEAFPESPQHRAWQDAYNTRPARRIHAPLAPTATTSAGDPEVARERD